MNSRYPFRPVLLREGVSFPDPALANTEGLVAIGGDFSVERLVSAYRSGIFPWTAQPITWWSPDPRGVIELDGFHVSSSLAKVIRKQIYTVTFDRAFREVMDACATPNSKRGATWIGPEFVMSYTRLHHVGHAHSVECWLGDELVGGVYGVAAGGLFAGESMFHRADNASKVALYHLVERLRAQRFQLFDVQAVTSATRPLGAKEIPRREYLDRLAKVVSLEREF